MLRPYFGIWLGRGNKVIFATSFGYMQPMLEVAKEFPNVRFEHATGYKTTENMRVYDNRGYQPSYLAGMIAGRMTKTNVLGVLGPFPDNRGPPKHQCICARRSIGQPTRQASRVMGEYLV